jgi:hypothetical protein
VNRNGYGRRTNLRLSRINGEPHGSGHTYLSLRLPFCIYKCAVQTAACSYTAGPLSLAVGSRARSYHVPHSQGHRCHVSSYTKPRYYEGRQMFRSGKRNTLLGYHKGIREPRTAHVSRVEYHWFYNTYFTTQCHFDMC